MGLIEYIGDSIGNSNLVMKNINTKILNLSNEQLLPPNVVADINYLNNKCTNATTQNDDAKRDNQEANEKAEEYGKKYQNAKDELQEAKSKMNIFTEMLVGARHPILNKIFATGGLGAAAIALGISSFGLLPGIGIGAAVIGAKMLGAGAYCKFSVNGQEYKRLKSQVQILKGQYALYRSKSQTTTDVVRYTTKREKEAQYNFNDYKKSVIEISKKYKEEFKLIKAYNKLTDQQKDSINGIFSSNGRNLIPIRERIRDYANTIKNCWYYNPNGITKPCHINGITDILNLIAKGKLNKIDKNDPIINLFMNNCRIPMPGITQAPPQQQPQQTQPTQTPQQTQPIQSTQTTQTPQQTQTTQTPQQTQTTQSTQTTQTSQQAQPTQSPQQTQTTSQTPQTTQQQPQSGSNPPVYGPTGHEGEPLEPKENLLEQGDLQNDSRTTDFRKGMRREPPLLTAEEMEKDGLHFNDIETMLEGVEVPPDDFLAALGYYYKFNTNPDRDTDISLNNALNVINKMDSKEAKEFAKVGSSKLSATAFRSNDKDPNELWISTYANRLNKIIRERELAEAQASKNDPRSVA